MKYFLKMQLALYFKKHTYVYAYGKKQQEREQTERNSIYWAELREANKQEKMRRESILSMNE